MKEIFVIYNKNTGFIDGGSGRIDRAWEEQHKDGSTILERIPEILAKDSNREVIYLPNQNVPYPEEFMVKSGKLKKMNASEKASYQAFLPKPKFQELEERIATLEGN